MLSLQKGEIMSKTTNIYLMCLTTGFVLFGMTAQISAQYAGGMGTMWNNPISASVSNILTDRLSQRSSSGLKTRSGSQPRSAATNPKITLDQINRAVKFHSAGTPSLALETVVNNFGSNLGQKNQLRSALSQLLDTYDEETTKNGYPNDLALAFSSFIAMTSAVYHETELPSENKVLELRNTIAEIAVRDGIFNSMNDRQKQTVSETLVLVSGFAYVGYLDAKRRGASGEAKIFQQLAGESIKKVLNLSPENVSFTKEGLKMDVNEKEVLDKQQTNVSVLNQGNALVGTWSDAAAGGFSEISSNGAVSTGRGGNALAYVFKADGTYIYQAYFDGVIGGVTVFIYETGNYKTSGNMLTLVSQRKLYRRNGVDDWSNVKETPPPLQYGFEQNELIFKINNSITRLRRNR